MTRYYVTNAADLGAAVRDLRPDAAVVGIAITDDWCHAQMMRLGITRYEDLDSDTIGAIADRVDEFAAD